MPVTTIEYIHSLMPPLCASTFGESLDHLYISSGVMSTTGISARQLPHEWKFLSDTYGRYPDLIAKMCELRRQNHPYMHFRGVFKRSIFLWAYGLQEVPKEWDMEEDLAVFDAEVTRQAAALVFEYIEYRKHYLVDTLVYKDDDKPEDMAELYTWCKANKKHAIVNNVTVTDKTNRLFSRRQMYDTKGAATGVLIVATPDSALLSRIYDNAKLQNAEYITV